MSLNLLKLIDCHVELEQVHICIKMTVEASSIWAWRGAEDWSSDQVCAVSGKESFPSQTHLSSFMMQLVAVVVAINWLFLSHDRKTTTT